MIHISFNYTDDKFDSLKIKGHGNEEKGYDLVCAGVSSCFIGAINALKELDKFAIKVQSGDSSVVRKEKISEHDEVVMETLLTQLFTIEQSNKQACKLEISKKEGKK